MYSFPINGNLHPNYYLARALIALHFIHATHCHFTIHHSLFHRCFPLLHKLHLVPTFGHAHLVHLMFHHFPLHHPTFNRSCENSPTHPLTHSPTRPTLHPVVVSGTPVRLAHRDTYTPFFHVQSLRLALPNTPSIGYL